MKKFINITAIFIIVEKSMTQPKSPIELRNYWKTKKQQQRQRDKEAKQKQNTPIQNITLKEINN